MNPLRPIDEQFTESYNQKGLQPSVGFVSPIRNVKVEKRGGREGGGKIRTAIRRPRKQKNISNQDSYLDNESFNHLDELGQEETEPTISGKIKGLSLKIKVSRININILYWAVPLYLFVQVPFAILSALSFTVAVFFNNFLSVKSDGGLLAEIKETILTALQKTLNFIGLDFAQIAQDFFIILNVLVSVIGLVSIAAVFLIYTLSGIKPLSGEMGGLKMGIFILVIIGYIIPLANLFPWILLWMAVVWKYPK